MRRARSFLAAAIVCAFALTGCAAIPHEGQIGTVQAGDSENDVQSRTDPDGPVPGASPSSIVRGFLSAGSSSASSFAVARSFLTEDFAGEWSPLKSVTVVDAGSSLESLTASVTTNSRNVSFTVPVQGVLDSGHIYRESPSGSESDLKFSLRQVNGEWRIAQAPDGIVLSEANFNSLFQSYPLYFYTQDYKYLVPDVRWFLRGSGTLTEVVREMLRGPADYLSGSVISVIPDGTALEPSVVTAESGTVDVGLSQEADKADQTTRERMYAQISQTMRANSSISDVRVQTPQSNITAGADVDVNFPVDVPPIAVSGGKIAKIQGNSFSPVPNSPKVSDKVIPAQDYSGGTFYFTSEDRKKVQMFTPEDREETLITGKDLVGVSLDRYDWAYTVEAKSAKLRAVGRNGELVRMSMPFAKDRTVKRIAVSRDGSRLAVLSSGSDGSRIDVVGIVRSRGGAPDHLVSGSPLSVGQKFKDLRDFSWAGSTHFAVLSSDDGSVQPSRTWAGGPSSSLGSISGGVNISAANDLHSMRIGADDGDIYTYTSGTWQRIVGAKAWNPTYPG